MTFKSAFFRQFENLATITTREPKHRELISASNNIRRLYFARATRHHHIFVNPILSITTPTFLRAESVVPIEDR